MNEQYGQMIQEIRDILDDMILTPTFKLSVPQYDFIMNTLDDIENKIDSLYNLEKAVKSISWLLKYLKE